MQTAMDYNSVGTARMGAHLVDVPRCPHCAIAKPLLVRTWASEGALGNDGHGDRYWATYYCTSCREIVLACGRNYSDRFIVEELYPNAKTAHEDIPSVARQFLQQAFETLHAPDAAAVMAGSAVDAMLKSKGFIEGSLYSRIDKALESHVLTQGMADWAHVVRLGSNRPRHADAEKPHVSADEAKHSVEFAEALGNFLFVLTARIDRGVKAAAAPSGRKDAQKVIKKVVT